MFVMKHNVVQVKFINLYDILQQLYSSVLQYFLLEYILYSKSLQSKLVY